MSARIGAAALLGAVWASAVHAQDVLPYCNDRFELDVGPALVDGDGWDRVAGKASVTTCFTGHAQLGGAAGTLPAAGPGGAQRTLFGRNGFPYSYAVRLEGAYLLASRDVRLPDASTLKASAGISLSLSEPAALAPDTLSPDELLEWDGGGFNWGFLDLGGTVGYEASADRSEQHLTLGAEARYGINGSGWIRIVPSLVGRWELVDPTRSVVRDALAVPGSSDRHGRWSLEAYWNVGLGSLTPRLESWRFQAAGSLYRTHGLEDALRAVGWQRGEHASATLTFAPRRPLVWRLELSSMYARYSLGQLPTQSAADRDALSGGIAIGVR